MLRPQIPSEAPIFPENPQDGKAQSETGYALVERRGI